MGVAALGMMMGQLQEANKDDYNTGAMLRQVMGTTSQGQDQQANMGQGGVGSFIQNMITGSPQAANANTNASNAQGGSPPSIGGMIMNLLQPKNQAAGADAETDANKYKAYNQSQFSPYTSSGSSGSSTSGWSY